MNKLVLIGLVAALCLVAVPTAAAHIVIGYPDPETGECTAKPVPGSEKFAHGSVSVYPCRYWHV